jgi:broad specificity phosphatase PhoE
MKHILLIRHGLPHEGHSVHPGDPPLHPHGMRHAQRLARRLQREGVDCIASSPQRRAMDTAQPLARLLGIASTIYEGLAEVDHGTDRYRSVETMQAEDAKRFSEFMASPARFFGKDPDQFRQGVLSAFEAAMREASGKRIAIFAHGMTIKTILCAALGTEEAYARLLINHCSVSRLSGHTPGKLRVDSINESLCKPV